ncbi:alginate lyase family protein [Dyadobacter bucti]|uniref:heparinase II/III family protein n=1 Tax=Dyadobacter bucti TaxID=2572203 RepID=UPI003F71746A
MGIRYWAFRIWYEFQRKTGLLRLRFPTKSLSMTHVTLEMWRGQKRSFLFDFDGLEGTRNTDLIELKKRAGRIQNHYFQYFHHQWYHVTDWHTNPQNGFVYNQNEHWSAIRDFSEAAGDIKYVWEKSRFTFLYDLIRYDYHFRDDQSQVIFSFIQDWILKNPVNRGPNWKCSQEITLRVLNWTFALHYYKVSRSLTQDIFDQIIHSIHDQMRHVAENISFSRIAVRNNHALTETLGLYVIGLLYPFLPGSECLKRNGKKWFEEEIQYQIYEDGTFLQFSMNYHRVVMQLLTWAIRLAHANGETWKNVVYEKAKKSLYFLRTCQDDVTGRLPNYGNNDGALFFPLSDSHFRDFRPQLAALAKLLDIDLGYGNGKWDEETAWISGDLKRKSAEQIQLANVNTFLESGYYVVRDHGSVTFLRCGAYRHRPFQADNLHLDIWANGENLMRDAGSFQYNTQEKWIRYFTGTASHNTVMLNDFNQMQKGKRFIWHNWIRKATGKVTMSAAEWNEDECSEDEWFILEGSFKGFLAVGKDIIHRRRVSKRAGQLHWIIEDWIENAPPFLMMHQNWHPCERFFDQYEIRAADEKGNILAFSVNEGWYSETYGHKIAAKRLSFSTSGRYIVTTISIKPQNAHTSDTPVFS